MTGTAAGPLEGLSVFIPVYNEALILEKNVVTVIEYLSTLGRPFEVLLGSNGSTDETPIIGAALARRDARVVFFHGPERGPGLAFARAVRCARYPNLVTVDADLSFDMGFVKDALEGLVDHAAVVGAKGSRQRRPLVRVVASEVFIRCSNLLLGLPFRDYAIGAKAFRTREIRPFIDKVDRHTFYTQQMIYELWKAHRRVKEVAVACEDHRASRFNLLHEGVYRYSHLFLVWYRSWRDRHARIVEPVLEEAALARSDAT